MREDPDLVRKVEETGVSRESAMVKKYISVVGGAGKAYGIVGGLHLVGVAETLQENGVYVLPLRLEPLLATEHMAIASQRIKEMDDNPEQYKKIDGDSYLRPHNRSIPRAFTLAFDAYLEHQRINGKITREDIAYLGELSKLMQPVVYNGR